jgi:hypothetical protein
LRLHAGHAAEHGDRAVEHAHGALHLGGEIHVAGSVNDVDAVRNILERLVHLVLARLDRLLRPVTRHRRRSDRDAAFAFLLHPVGDRVAVVHVANLVNEAGVKENALGRGRLARVNVRGDADVARALQRIFAVWTKRPISCFVSLFWRLLASWFKNKKRPDVKNTFGAR